METVSGSGFQMETVSGSGFLTETVVFFMGGIGGNRPQVYGGKNVPP
jgi:hypothetical protein